MIEVLKPASKVLLLAACIFIFSAAVSQTRYYREVTVDGVKRTYLVNLPREYNSSKQHFPLVIALHGGGGSAYQFERTSLLTQKANASKFIVAYPEGLQSDRLLRARTWNAGACCDYAVRSKVNDVKFISLLIDTLVKAFSIDERRVYATGHSNGGMMTYRLACELPGKFAAIAPNACTMVVDALQCSGAVPILHMHSVLDKHVPYKGGVGKGPGSGTYYTPVDSVLGFWAGKAGCTAKPQVVNNGAYIFAKWAGCNKNLSIEYYLTLDGGHGWPGSLPGGRFSDTPSKAIVANDLLWSFFQRFTLP